MIRAVALLWCLLAGQVAAHTTDMAVLRLIETSRGTYQVAWDVRTGGDLGGELQPLFPSQCTLAGARLTCGDTRLRGRLGIAHRTGGQAAAIILIRDLDGYIQVHTLTPARPVIEVSPGFDLESWEGIASIATVYVRIGIDHILQGVDHLLFVLGLLWIARGGWMLYGTITAFTLAHTVTLVAVTFGWLGVSEALVNTLIALSIVFIGVEIQRAEAGGRTLTLSYPWAVAILFGLLHGAGFADALVSVGLPREAVPLALLSFNLGVEIGQIAFVLLALALAWSYRVMGVDWPRWSRPLPAYTIGALAAFWFFDRAAILLGT